jgi:CheY-like chemotaxis protein/two-component sensor histidine kinase
VSNNKENNPNNFFAIATHELKSPLNSILGFASLLLEEETDEKKIEKLKIIRDSSKYLLNLINDILDISKIEASKLKILKLNFLLISTLRHVENLFSITAKEKNINFSIEIDKSIPNVVCGDELRITQILINLLSNAFKFTGTDGSVTLKCYFGSGLLNFIVSDSGIGIPADKIDEIFLPFEQADSTTVKKYGGTGLGLTITKKLAEIMDGSIKVESVVGKGTSFIVSLPIAVIETPVVKDDNFNKNDPEEMIERWIRKLGKKEEMKDIILYGIQKLPDRIFSLKTAVFSNKIEEIRYLCHQIKGFTGSYGMTEIYKKLIEIDNEVKKEDYDIEKAKNILSEIENIISAIPQKYFNEKRKLKFDNKKSNLKPGVLKSIIFADDSYENQELIKTFIRGIKVNYDFAANGKEVLELLSKKNYDILFLDMNMPVMNGFETIKEIRSDDKLKNLYVIAFTAEDKNEFKEKVISSGCNDFIEKPIEKELFIKKLLDMIS